MSSIPVTSAGWRQVRCPECNKLLLKVKGIAEIETVCPRCSSKVLWPDLEKVTVLRPIAVLTCAARGSMGVMP